MPTQLKAWSPRLWQEIGRNTPVPTISTMVEECKILCRAVFPHRAEGSLIVKNAGQAFWSGLSPAETLRWRQALTGWGWLSTTGKPLDWLPETEIALVRLGIWVWTRSTDGALPKVMSRGAVTRRDSLMKKRYELDQHPVWKKLGVDELPARLRIEQAGALLAGSAEEDRVAIKGWVDIERELQWKHEVVPKVERWLTKHPAIPPTTGALWLDAWRRETTTTA